MSEEEYCDEWSADGRTATRAVADRWQNFTAAAVQFTIVNWAAPRLKTPEDRRTSTTSGEYMPGVSRTYCFLAAGQTAPPAPPADPRHQYVFVPHGTSVLIPREHTRAIQDVRDGFAMGGLAPQLTRIARRGETPVAVRQHPALTAKPQPPPVAVDAGRIERLRARAAGGVQ